MSVHQIPHNNQQKRDRSVKEYLGRYTNKPLLGRNNLHKDLEDSYHQIAKDIGRYGTKHPHTAMSFHQAAILHSDNKQVDIGLNLFKISHNIHKYDEGDNNINNSSSYGSIATASFELGHYQEALDNGLKALKLYKLDSRNDIGDPPSIRKQWELAQVYLALGRQKQKTHEFADARHLYAQGLKHALDAEKGIHTCWPHSDIDKKHCKMIIDSIKTQARTLPPPPEWLPSGTVKDMTEPFQDNKLPFDKPEPPLKAKL